MSMLLVVQPPVGIETTQTDGEKARVTWKPVENVLMYQVTIQNLDEPTRKPSVYNVTDTKLDVNGIRPCSSYLITVSSFSKFLLLSEPTNYNYSTNMHEQEHHLYHHRTEMWPILRGERNTYIRQLQEPIQHHFSFISDWVTWKMNSGTLFYIAVAKASDNVINSCNSIDASCIINGLKCSSNYTVYVIASNFYCNSSESKMIPLKTADCSPSNVTTSLDCASNEALISWQWESPISSFTASIVDDVDGRLSCSSTTTSCKVPNLKCGRLYNVSVSHRDAANCSSMPSQFIYMESAPCDPANVTASLNCLSDVVTVTWSASAGANYYTVIAEANGYVDSCNSTSTSCGLTRLQCGENYTVTVLAGDTRFVIRYICSNTKTLEFPLNQIVKHLAVFSPSAPCTPGNVEHQYYCGPGNALVSWDEALGRDSFYVRTQSGNHTVFCTASQDTDCSLPPLQCSRTYDVEVIAVAANCNSSVPGITKIQTGKNWT
ncbi:hypothetical protein XENOCAPTIV_000729 [Xenoophorus captivus]|uniref:Fibronectin type-III domain-containing protein n=1 Tax=Xenoophorus captivus TaxID=1517983 RepID=A0ABV0RVA4_9TELE